MAVADRSSAAPESSGSAGTGGRVSRLSRRSGPGARGRSVKAARTEETISGGTRRVISAESSDAGVDGSTSDARTGKLGNSAWASVVDSSSKESGGGLAPTGCGCGSSSKTGAGTSAVRSGDRPTASGSATVGASSTETEESIRPGGTDPNPAKITKRPSIGKRLAGRSGPGYRSVVRRADLLAVLAGFTGLGAETLYFKVLDAVVGSAPLTSQTVVATFILAMGLGSAGAVRVRRLARVELLAAGLHLLMFGALAALPGLVGPALQALSQVLGPSLAAAAIGATLVAPPAFLAGLGLPAIIEFGGHTGRSYALHALGAVTAVGLLELYVHPQFGLPGGLAVLIVAHLGSAAAFAGLVMPRLPSGMAAWVPSLGLIGVVTGAAQGAFLFLAELAFGPYAFVAPTVVAMMLLGLFLGGALAGPIGLSRANACWATGLGLAGSVASWAWAFQTSRPESIAGAVLELLFLILPVAVPIGAIFPAHFGRSPRSRGEVGAGAWSLSLGNAFGLGLLGILSAHLPLLWLPLALSPILWPLVGGRLRAGVVIGSSLGAAALALQVSQAMIVARTAQVGAQEITEVQLQRGPGELAGTYRAPTRRLYQNGYHPIDLDAGAESLIAAVGVAYAPGRTRALVLGAGSGRSAGTVAQVFRTVEVIDVSPLTPRLLETFTADNGALLRRPGVRVHTLDGIMAPAVLEPGFDLIVLTVDPGFCARAAKLYTVEALAALDRLLAPGGVLIFWSDREVGEEATQILINTAQRVWPEQKIFSAIGRADDDPGYYFLVQSRAPLRYRPGLLYTQIPPDLELSRLPGFSGPQRPGSGGPIDSEEDRLIRRRFHSTEAVHELWHPAPALIFRGYGPGMR